MAFKTTDFLMISFIFTLFSLSLMVLGNQIINNNNVYLSNNSQTYLYSYVQSANQTFDSQNFQSNVEQIEGNTQNNLTTSETTDDYAFQFRKTREEFSQIKFALNIVTNIPSFTLSAFGFNVEYYRTQINVITWFLVILLVIAGVLFWNGLI